MDTITKPVSSLWDFSSPVLVKALSLGVMIGGLILMDTLLHGTGIMLAGAVLFFVVMRSDIPDKAVQLLNWASQGVRK